MWLWHIWNWREAGLSVWGELSQAAFGVPKSSPSIFRVWDSFCFRGYEYSPYMVICGLLKCPGKKDYFSLFHCFSLNFSNLRLWLFKKGYCFHRYKFKSPLMPLPLCTYLTKASCYAFRQLRFSNNFCYSNILLFKEFLLYNSEDKLKCISFSKCFIIFKSSHLYV